MSAFKDFVAADVQNVFINLDEFSEEHEIGHEVVPCILDKIITQANGDDSYLGFCQPTDDIRRSRRD